MSMFASKTTHVVAIAAFAALTAPASAQQAASTLPGGASSLQETYQDWALNCKGTPQTVCAISQQQQQQNGKRVLAVELQRNDDSALSGVLVLPFGLALDAGVALQIDDAAPQEPLRFSTCMPGGCIVPLSFDSEKVAALRAGTALKVEAQSTDAKEMTFSISLKGIAPALDRLGALSQTRPEGENE